MGWILLAACIFGIIGFGLLLDAMFENDDKAGNIGIASMLICFFLLGLLVFASVKCEKQPWERAEEPYVTHTIIALSDGNEIDGKFRGSRYCMSGYINEKFTYVYGYKTVGGGMKIQKAGADVSTVYFNDDIEPCAKWYKWTKTFWGYTKEKRTCDIYVPTDSLEASITIDLE